MKIHLNEKLWFGKYKDERLIDIIDNHPNYINKLYNDYEDITLSDDAYDYYKNRINKKSKKSMWSFEYRNRYNRG